MSKKLINLINWVGYKLLGRELGAEGLKFFQNLGWVSLGMFGSSLLTFVFTSLAARYIGPEQFGLANLAISFSLFIQLVIGLGFTLSSVKYISATDDPIERKKIISTTFIYVVVSSIIFSSLVFISSVFWSKTLNVPLVVIYLAIIYTIPTTIYLILEGYLRALGLYKQSMLIYILSGIIYILSVAILIFGLGYLNAGSWVGSIAIRWLFFALAAVFFLVKLFGFGLFKFFDYQWFKKLLRYGLLSFWMMAVVGLSQIFDRFILNYFWSAVQVGIYSAYITASSVATGKILQVFTQVFFPTMSGRRDHKEIFGLINRLFFIILGGFFAISLITTYIGLLIYGKGYDFKIAYLLLFSFNTALFTIVAMYNWLIISRNESGVKFVAAASTIGLAVDIVLNLIFIPSFSINGAIITTIIVLFYYLGLINWYFNRQRV